MYYYTQWETLISLGGYTSEYYKEVATMTLKDRLQKTTQKSLRNLEKKKYNRFRMKVVKTYLSAECRKAAAIAHDYATIREVGSHVLYCEEILTKEDIEDFARRKGLECVFPTAYHDTVAELKWGN